MKVFISWSGELSKSIANILNEQIPFVIQSVETFFSPEDINKGDKWNETISKELKECSFCIVCLTDENVEKPWINFEAGAISNALNGRVSGLAININKSDIKGPLRSFQNITILDKNDMFLLFKSINESEKDKKLDIKKLEKSFNFIWNELKNSIETTINDFVNNNKAKPLTKVSLEQQRHDEIIESLNLQYNLLKDINVEINSSQIYKYLFENVLLHTNKCKSNVEYTVFLHDLGHKIINKSLKTPINNKIENNE